MLIFPQNCDHGAITLVWIKIREIKFKPQLTPIEMTTSLLPAKLVPNCVCGNFFRNVNVFHYNFLNFFRTF